MLRLIVVLFTIVLSAPAWAAQVDGVRLWRSPDSTRVVFDLSAPIEHRLFTLKNPSRVVIDIDNTHFAKALKDLPLENTPIAKVRVGKREKSGLRVVLDLKQAVNSRSFVLPKQAGKSDRLVVDLLDKKNTTRKTVEQVSDGGRRDIIVAIDAGHGGEDPGAIGPGRVREKEVVLKICKQLFAMINAQPGYKAVMVRTGDYYVPLVDRRDKAREVRADLFVSVHADAFHSPRASGASVFALSSRGATSESARFLAQKENEADLIGGVGGVKLTDVDTVLAGVLVDLSMTATLSNSLNVGSRVLREMGKITKLHKRSVEQAGFAVLKSPDVPSILVETGFISNPGEARKLNTYAHRRKLATAIFNGIKTYFYDAPPAGSYVAWAKRSGRGLHEYVVTSGDTLSGIAAKHNVSLKALLQHNGIGTSTVIKIGQKLAIPAG